MPCAKTKALDAGFRQHDDFEASSASQARPLTIKVQA
jgi:hypothetical protein